MSTPETMTNCPSEETLAAFIDGRLDPEARQRVIEHMAVCGDCYAVITAALDLRATEPAMDAPVGRGRFGGRGWWVGAAAAVGGVMVALILSSIRFRQTPYSSEKDLTAASDALDYRAISARVSIDVAYKPKKPRMRSRGPSDEPEQWQLLAAAGKAEADARRKPTVHNLDLAAVGALLLSKPDQSVVFLQQALLLETDNRSLAEAIAHTSNVNLLIDLTAALIARGEQHNRAADYVDALEVADRAWKLRKTPVTLWNRAITLELLNLRQAAADAWRDYLKIDQNSAWRDEAVKRLQTLTQPPLGRSDFERAGTGDLALLARRDPFEALIYAEDQLFPRWADAVLGYRPAEASKLMERCRVLGQVLNDRGESAIANSITSLDAAALNGSSNLRAIATLYVRFAGARGDMESKSYNSALRQLQSIYDELAAYEPRFPLKARIALALATCHFYESRFTDSRELSMRVYRSNASPAIRGTAAWLAALCNSVLGKLDTSLNMYRAALQEFERCQYSQQIAAVEALYADILQRSGDTREGWRYRISAFKNLGAHQVTSARFAVIANDCARIAIKKRKLAFAHYLLEAARTGVSDPTQLAETGLLRAFLATQLGEDSEALREVARVRDLLITVPDPNIRERLSSMCDASQGSAIGIKYPRRAIVYFQAAIDAALRVKRTFGLAELYLGRAQAELKAGDSDAAVGTLTHTLEIIARESQGLQERNFGLPSPIDTSAVYPFIIEATLRRHDVKSALRYALRARMVYPFPVDRAGATLPTRTTARSRPLLPNEAFVVFADLPDREVAWIIRLNSTRMYLLARGDPTSLRDTAEEAIEARRDDDARELLNRLYLRWFAQLRPALQGVDTLMIVPSRAMRGFPLSALYDGRLHLIDVYHVVLVTPQISASTRTDSQATIPLLLVDAAPATDADIVLPAVNEELDAISSAAHLRYKALVRPTKSELLAMMSTARNIHFAGHGEVNTEEPLRSYLALPHTYGVQRLYAAEISRTSLTNTHLAVLSACSGASRSDALRPQYGSMSDAFLAAGTDLVIGALWPIRDDETAVFFQQFYSEYTRHGDAVAALTNVKRHLSRSPTAALASWCSFEITSSRSEEEICRESPPPS